MHWPLFAARIFTLASLLFLTACGGGGGGGGGGGNVFALNGGAVSASLSGSVVPYNTYTFNVVTDVAYTVSTKTTAGDILLTVYNGNSINGSPIGYSWNSLATTPYNNVSFIATSTGVVTVQVVNINVDINAQTFGQSSYTLAAFDGNLAIGSSKTASTYNNSILYSFDATNGTAYQVRLTPQTGNVDIASVYLTEAASIGSSTLTGTAIDTVTFQATATQRYYIRVSTTSVDSTFNIQVDTAVSDPDLRVVVDTAVSDGSNVTVSYTVYNQGLNPAGAFGVTGWSHSVSAPIVGSTGQATPSSHTSLASGASLSGSFVIANSSASGTAYAIVDNGTILAEANETNNVSVGKYWEKPLAAEQNFTFEAGVIPTSMVMSGNAGWVIDSTTGGASSPKSLKAGTIGSSQSSCVTMSVTNGQSISFDYRVSSESYYDTLNFYIDGVQYWAEWSGTVAWTNSGAIAVSSAPHEYKWCYIKDFTGIFGSDTAWIDNIVVVAAPPPTVDLRAVINSAVSSGSNVTVNYTITNLGNSASAPFNVDLWSNSASAPTVGTSGETSVATASLAAGASVNGSVILTNNTSAGTAYAIVDTANAVDEVDETNNVSASKAWSVSIDLQVVVNSAISDQTNVVVNYTVSNKGANPASSPFTVDIWSDSATVPELPGTAGAKEVAIASLSAGASTTGVVTLANTNASGTAYAVVDRQNTVGEGVEDNNVSLGKAWLKPLSAPLSYNFNDSLVPTNMVMSGNTAWAANTSGKGNNTVLGLKAGTITHSQTSCVAVSAVGATSVQFDYSVDSEVNFDFLRFYIDGVLIRSWSGTVALTPVTAITVTTGLHEYKWCYSKDNAGTVGGDTARIDNIVIN